MLRKAYRRWNREKIHAYIAEKRTEMALNFRSHRIKHVEQFLLDEEKLLKEKNVEEEWTIQPLVSVVVIGDVERVSDFAFRECITSIATQTYENWELLFLKQDITTRKEIKKAINQSKKILKWKNKRRPVKVIEDIILIKGDYFIFVDVKDSLATFALSEFVKKLSENNELSYIYSDEDKISVDSKKRSDPFFKPSWSPDLMISFFYTRNLSFYSTKVAKQIGSINHDFQGDCYYDFALRFTEAIDRKNIGHISEICYHYRKENGVNSRALLGNYPGIKLAIIESLKRRKIKGTVQETEFPDTFRIMYEAEEAPLVSIIIPSKDNIKILHQCLKSIKELTEYCNYEVIVVDNGSKEEVKLYLEKILNKEKWKYIYQNMPFNFSKMCNIGVANSSGEYVLLLNDDIEVIQKDWLKVMLGQATQVHTGAVGAKLLYPDSEMIQHIGVGTPHYAPDHILKHHYDGEVYYFGRNRLTYNYVSVTGACLMVKKIKYIEVGGFDENFPIAYNDVDFCIKLYQLGYYNVMRNDVWLYHHESLSRGEDVNDEVKHERLNVEKERLRKKHPILAFNDPFYHKYFLDNNKMDYSIKVREIENEEAELRFKEHWIIPEGGEFYKLAIDEIEYYEDTIKISGWVLTDGRHDFLYNKVMVFQGDNQQVLEVDLNRVYRPDVSELYGENAEFAGFEIFVDSKFFEKGIKYKIGFKASYSFFLEELFSWSKEELLIQ